MSLKGQDIRTLRQRLGWSLAEMARQMGCTTALIIKWEEGSETPEPESMNRLVHMASRVDVHSMRISQKPIAEKEMESRRMGQVTHRDLLKDN